MLGSISLLMIQTRAAGVRDIEAEQERDRCFEEMYDAMFFDFDPEEEIAD